MGYAFISYSSKDKAAASAIKSIFTKNNINCWLAPDNIPVGSTYAQAITNAVKSCACCVLLLSKSSVASQWVPREVERAISCKKAIIPLQLEDDVLLTDELELYIGSKQILPIRSLNEDSAEMQSFISAVKAYTQSAAVPSAAAAQATMFSVQPQQPKPVETKKSGFKRFVKIAVVLSAVSLVLNILLSLFSLLLEDDKKDADNDVKLPSIGDFISAGDSTSITDTTSNTDSSVSDSSVSDSSVSDSEAGINRIPDRYKSKVTALMYADDLSLNNSTVRVSVGGYVTPLACRVWTNATIYSQNTDIAIGEGSVVKGVSKGETYVVVVSNTGSSTAYRVIVE